MIKILHEFENSYLFERLVLFQDEEVAHKILWATDPLTMKIQGRKVRGFDDNVWTTQCVEIVTRGVKAKVRLDTGTRKTEHHYRNKLSSGGQGKTRAKKT